MHRPKKPPQVLHTPWNHPPVYKKADVAKQMVSDEVALKRILGPYDKCPLPGLICSPLNLVPKAGNPGKYRLIHNLTFPYNEDSINANIPGHEAKVEYQKFDVAIKLGLKHGRTAHASKVDFDVAFRNFPIFLKDLLALGFTSEDKFYINLSMAFGARSSCKIFEDFACAIQWILEQRTRSTDISHYLDDFIMVHALKATCKYYMTTMQKLCEHIGFPLSDSKTEGPCQIITFLGVTINFLKQVVTIPAEKIDKVTKLIKEMLETLKLKDKNKHGKVTMKSIQKLTGTLNFFCKVIPCGCPFL